MQEYLITAKVLGTGLSVILLLSRNLLVYGLGGLAAPFIFVKLIDVLLVFTGLM